MENIKLAIVGDDGSSRAALAVGWCRDLAAASGVELIVVNVDVERPAVERLAELEARVGGPARADGLACSCRALTGDPREKLVQEAETAGAGLLVVGDTSTWGLLRPPVGSVAGFLAHHSPCPVVVVPGAGPSLRRGTIVAGVDGSAGSAQALAWAATLAAGVEARVVAVFVYDPLADSYAHPPDVSNWHYRHEVEARAVVEGVQVPGVDIELTLVGANRIEGLLDTARKTDAGLIVVGARGRGGFHRLLLGGTATQLLHHSHRPVAIVPNDPRHVA